MNSFSTDDEGCNSSDIVGSFGVEIFIRSKSRKKEATVKVRS